MASRWNTPSLTAVCGWWLVVAVVGSLGISGCHAERRSRLRAEAAALLHQIDTLREAPNADKQRWVDLLAAQRCTFAEVCDLRAICDRGYRRHVAAYATIQRLAGVASATPHAPSILASELADAEAALKDAQPDITECVDGAASLRRRLDL